MLERICELLQKEKIDCIGCLPLEVCDIQKPHLLERAGIQRGSVVIFAIPYYSEACSQKRNLSAYAVARDYHLYFRKLSESLLPLLKSEYPGETFAAFADHSPINERMAAAKAGLGILGQNNLLITPRYASYVFLGEIITTAMLPDTMQQIRKCEACGSCLAACPMSRGQCTECLSAITQKKGHLTESEVRVITTNGMVWGCDICQEACPHTAKAKRVGSLVSPIDFFHEETIPFLSSELLLHMTECDFADRAYSWRGRDTVARNLAITEKQFGDDSQQNKK